MYSEFNMQTLITATFAIGFVIYGFIVFASDYKANLTSNCADLLQPWKLATLTIGFAWLIFGALTYEISDWDVGVSVVMATLTYVSAPWCVRTIIGRKWKLIAGVMVMSWFSSDGSYVLWHNLMGNEMLREANFPASASLYWLCGFIWLPRGSIREIFSLRARLQ